MKSNTITFFNNAFDKASEGLTDEQLGKALKLLVAEAKGDKVPFIDDKQVFFAYNTLRGSMEYIIHATRRQYAHHQNELMEARINAI